MHISEYVTETAEENWWFHTLFPLGSDTHTHTFYNLVGIFLILWEIKAFSEGAITLSRRIILNDSVGNCNCVRRLLECFHRVGK